MNLSLSVNGMRLEKYPTKKNIEELWRIDLSVDEFRAETEMSGQFPWVSCFLTIKFSILQ